MNTEKDDDYSEKKPDHVRPDEGPIDEKEMHTLVHGILSDAEDYCDDELSPERERATDYYLGKPFGNEEDGRSQFVLTELRDGVKGVLPGLMRMFTGPERTVEFRPMAPGKEEGAKQATDYIHHVFFEENDGFIQLHSAFKDAMVRKIGVLKWGWDETTSTKTYKLEGLDEQSLEALTGQEGVKLTSVRTDDAGVSTVEFTVTAKDGKPWIKALPPEELIFSRMSTNKGDAMCIAHRTYKTRGELIALGVDEDDIDEHAAGVDDSLEMNTERIARKAVAEFDSGGSDPEAGEANEKIKYIEAYVRIDTDGDGFAELRKVCTIGPNYHVVNGDGLGEPVNEVPIAIGSPDPEPHTMLGMSFMDDLGPIQLVKSSVLRSTLDSLALSIYPRTAYVEGQAAVEDILNNEIGAPMRMRVAGAIQPFAHPFTGKEAFPFFDFFDSVAEGRLGRDKGSMGLDADALQSSTDDAVKAAVASSNERQELLARIFAETLLKPMFKGVYGLFVQHQPKARTVRLRGKWVNIDPSVWDADCDVEVKVAIGTSLIEQRVNTLMQIAAKQQEILSLLGPSNPLVTMAQFRNTLARIVELRGFPDAELFFNQVPADWQPPAAPAPGPTPEQLNAQAQIEVEKMKSMRELAIKEKELELKERELELNHEMSLQKLASDTELRRFQMDLQFKGLVSSAQMDASVAHTKTLLELELKHRAQDHTEAVGGHDQALAADAQDHEQTLAEDDQAHSQEMDRAALAQQATQGAAE